VRVEESVGQRVRARRDELGMTQEEFGRRVGQLLGRPWSRSTVSVAEKGDRAWAAADLVAVAIVLQATVGELFRPPSGETAVSLGGEDPVPRDMLFAVSTARPREDLNFAAIQETLSRLEDSLARGRDSDVESLKLARDLDGYLMERLAGGGVIRLPVAGAGVDPTPANREAISRDDDQ
jgi:transcriptional regulator with XRE-family HTH domain